MALTSRASSRKRQTKKDGNDGPPKAKKGRKVVPEVPEDSGNAEVSPAKAGKGKNLPDEVPDRVTPPRRAKKSQNKATLGVKRSRVVPVPKKRGKQQPSVQDQEPKVNGEHNNGAVQEASDVLDKSANIFDALHQSKGDENGLLPVDSDDQISDADTASSQNHSQMTMEGDVDYTRKPGEDTSDDETGSEDNGQEHQDANVSKMRVVPEDVSVLDDPTKSHETWWSEDPTREETLCDLWAEEESLFVMSADGHRQPAKRDAILRKFSVILRVPPHIIYTRMNSIRNAYQKMHREAPSGSEPVGRTPRQREILRLAYFLRDHIKTADSITSYKGRSPAPKKVYSYQKKKGVTPKKPPGNPSTSSKKHVESTPIQRPKAPSTFDELRVHLRNVVDLKDKYADLKKLWVQDKDPEPMKGTKYVDQDLDVSDIVEEPLTPMKSTHTLTASEAGDSEDEFVTNTKHFGRNNRLTTPEGQEVSARRSLRLTPENRPTEKVKKTTDTSKIKTSKVKKPTVTKKKADVPKPSTSKQAVKRPDERTVMKSPSPADTSTAAVRKAKIASPVNGSDQNYSVMLDVDGEVDGNAWYTKQGPAFRKAQEAAKQRSKKDDPLIQVFQEKAETMKGMVASINKMASSGTAVSAPTQAVASPEQLWADSLVPHLGRMDQIVRDKYMYHVLGLAFRAINGSWPHKDED